MIIIFSQLFAAPQTMNVASGPMLYYLHPDVSFFKGNGFTALGPYLDMPDNSAAGNVSGIGSSLCFLQHVLTFLVQCRCGIRLTLSLLTASRMTTARLLKRGKDFLTILS